MTLSTRKRCSIKALPNHLVIHLKRFDFDFDTMQQTKVGCFRYEYRGRKEEITTIVVALSNGMPPGQRSTLAVIIAFGTNMTGIYVTSDRGMAWVYS